MQETIFLLVSFTMFVIVFYGYFINQLPFHYILFFFVGFFLSRLFKLTYKTEWHEQRKKVIRSMDIQSLVLLIILIAARYLIIPKFIGSLNIVFVTDAIFLIAIGIFLERIFYFKRTIDNYRYEYSMMSKE